MLYEEGSHSRIFYALMTDLLSGSPTAACQRQLRGCLRQWQQLSDHSNQPSMRRCSSMHRSRNCHKAKNVSSQNLMELGGGWDSDDRESLWTAKTGHNRKTKIACLCPPFSHPDANTSWNCQLRLQNICLRQTNGTTLYLHSRRPGETGLFLKF